MLKVGLTGSIAVGKSFVCEVLRELGCFVLDADLTAREVVAPGTEGLNQIVKEFGEVVLNTNGELNRELLGSIVFREPKKRERLNSIIHPRVIESQDQWMMERERENPHGIAVIDAALMIESGGYKRFEKLIVVWCEAEVQISRLMKRNGLSREGAILRITSQMPQDEKKRFADYLIDTTNGFDETRRLTTLVFEELRALTKH